jgi:P27 family predicted phage terminase small subunit
MKGRPPTPRHVLKLRGSKHANNREELGEKPESEMLPPEWLKPRAKEIFRAVVEWLTGFGTLAVSDEHVITRYATTYVIWEFAAKQLQQIDVTHVEVLGPGGAIKFARNIGPMAQFRESGEALRHLETVLGLTPADRTRLGYGATKVVVNDTDELFDREASAGG